MGFVLKIGTKSNKLFVAVWGPIFGPKILECGTEVWVNQALPVWVSWQCVRIQQMLPISGEGLDWPGCPRLLLLRGRLPTNSSQTSRLGSALWLLSRLYLSKAGSLIGVATSTPTMAARCPSWALRSESCRTKSFPNFSNF